MRLFIFVLGLSIISGCCRSKLTSPCQSQNSVVKLTPEKPILEVRGGEHLDGLHPQLVKKARLLYELVEKEGIQIKFISGYRRFRKKRSTQPGRSVASWHNFGAAFDLNLFKRKNMRVALAHYEEDQAQWNKIGDLAESLGLIWGKPWGKEEIFHFEWHPGHPEALRQPAFERLIQVTGAQVKDYQKAWTLFEDDGES